MRVTDVLNGSARGSLAAEPEGEAAKPLVIRRAAVAVEDDRAEHGFRLAGEKRWRSLNASTGGSLRPSRHAAVEAAMPTRREYLKRAGRSRGSPGSEASTRELFSVEDSNDALADDCAELR